MIERKKVFSINVCLHMSVLYTYICVCVCVTCVYVCVNNVCFSDSLKQKFIVHVCVRANIGN